MNKDESQTPLRILLLGNFLSGKRPGSRWVCEDLAIAFRQVGWEVVTASNYSGRIARLVHMLWTALSQRNRYDVALVDVYSHGAFRLAECLGWVLRSLKKPFVLTLHGGLLPEFSERRKRRVRWFFEAAVVVTAPSRWMCREMRPYCREVRYLPNPVAGVVSRDRDEFAQRLIWIRAFEGFYQPEMAIRVFARVRATLPAVTLTMVGRDKGDGSFQRTQELVRELGLGDSVSIIAGVAKSAVPSLLADADLFLNTSRVDNAPVVLLEAFAAGIPVVSTRVGGIPDMIEHGVSGILVDANDEASMVDNVVSLLTDADRMKSLAAHARREALACETKPVVAAWEVLFRDVLGQVESRRQLEDVS